MLTYKYNDMHLKYNRKFYGYRKIAVDISSHGSWARQTIQGMCSYTNWALNPIRQLFLSPKMKVSLSIPY